MSGKSTLTMNSTVSLRDSRLRLQDLQHQLNTSQYIPERRNLLKEIFEIYELIPARRDFITFNSFLDQNAELSSRANTRNYMRQILWSDPTAPNNNSAERFRQKYSTQRSVPQPRYDDANDDTSLESISSEDRTPRQNERDKKNVEKMKKRPKQTDKHDDTNDEISLESINSEDRTPHQNKQDKKNVEKMKKHLS